MGEFKEMRDLGLHAYSRNYWNVFDFINIALFVVTLCATLISLSDPSVRYEVVCVCNAQLYPSVRKGIVCVCACYVHI
jgi:hypothetical protein